MAKRSPGGAIARQDLTISVGTVCKGVLRSVRDTGEIYEKGKHDQQWVLWTRLDETGIRRVSAILSILHNDGWQVLG